LQNLYEKQSLASSDLILQFLFPMRSIIFLICLALTFHATNAACNGTADCSYRGSCSAGSCVCFTGFYGSQCESQFFGSVVGLSIENGTYTIFSLNYTNLQRTTASLGNSGNINWIEYGISASAVDSTTFYALNSSQVYPGSYNVQLPTIFFVAYDSNFVASIRMRLSNQNIQTVFNLTEEIFSLQYDTKSAALYALLQTKLVKYVNPIQVSPSTQQTVLSLPSVQPLGTISAFSPQQQTYFALFTSLYSTNFTTTYLLGISTNTSQIVFNVTVDATQITSLSIDSKNQILYITNRDTATTAFRLQNITTTGSQTQFQLPAAYQYPSTTQYSTMIHSLGIIESASNSTTLHDAVFLSGSQNTFVRVNALNGSAFDSVAVPGDLVFLTYSAPIGCDLLPNSNTYVDVCGVCGGTSGFVTVCPSPSPSISPTPSITPTRTPTPSATSSPSTGASPSPTSTTTPTSSSTPTATMTPSASITPSTTPSQAPTPSVTPSSSASPMETDNLKSSSGDSNFMIVGGIIAGVVGLFCIGIIILVAVIVSRKKSNKRKKEDIELQPQKLLVEEPQSPYGGVAAVPPPPSSKKDYDGMPAENILGATHKNYEGMPTNEELQNDNTALAKDQQKETEWWKISFDELQVGTKIGAGGFGVVYRGKWRDQDVAIKMLHRDSKIDKSQFEEFQREAALMVTLKPHVNVVKLLGVCLDPDRPMAIVTEYCELGSLRKLLDDKSIDIPMTKVVDIVKDISKGMAHLHHEKVYHRDLSARNILVSEGKKGWICKVADFGLSRFSESQESTTKSDTGPLKWMSPESLLEKKYSAKSDVWSFGVTLWECLTRLEPYPEMDNVQAASLVMHKGLVLKPPENCPPKLADLMTECFERDPSERPSFKQILKVLTQIEEELKTNPFY